jgi:hypothetical protein
MNTNALTYAAGAILLGVVGICFHDFAMQWQPVPASIGDAFWTATYTLRKVTKLCAPVDKAGEAPHRRRGGGARPWPDGRGRRRAGRR